MLTKKRESIIESGQYTLAPFWRRFIALMVDLTIIFYGYYFISKFFSAIGYEIEKIDFVNLAHVELESTTMSHTTLEILKVVLGLMPAIYFSLMFFLTNGLTVGKFLLRIRVVSLYHHRIGYWHCFERSLGYAASVLELGLGFVQAFWNPNRMALHDKIGETIVVRIEKKKKEIIEEEEDA